MNEWKIGIAIAPLLIMAMAALLYSKRAITRTTLFLALAATTAIATLLLTM